jgi:nucleoside phosphorylase/tetratricopeptide (TPR) repeat protein
MSSKGRPLRVGIITALRDEYQQVLSVDVDAIDDTWTEKPGLDGRLIAERTFRCDDGSELQVFTTWATEMGGIATAALATQLIEKYKPDCMSMSGICAGRRGKVSLGDVIFADRLWTYDSGKLVVTKGARGERVESFEGDMLQFKLPERWKQRAQAHSVGDPSWVKLRPIPIEYQGSWLLMQLIHSGDPQVHPDRKTNCPDWIEAITFLRKEGLLKKRGLEITKKGELHAKELSILFLNSLPETEPFRIHVAPIATGSQVVEDPDIFKRLSLSMRKVLGVEMEASALGMVGDLENVPVFVAKAVSDYADRKDDRFRIFAARASAETLLSFLRGNLPGLLTYHAARNSLRDQDTHPFGPNLLPRDLLTFTGRNDQLDELIRELIPNEDGVGTAIAIDAIDGMAGIGKTTLAVHAAHLVARYYPDGLLFIELHGYTPGRNPVEPATALDQLLRALGVPAARIPDGLDERSSLWRSEIARRRALILLDNARTDEQVRALLPGAGGSRVVITSRRRLTSLQGVRHLSLDLLPEDDAVCLLLRVVDRAKHEHELVLLRRVVQLCGYLPLAIQLVGNRWRHRPSWQLHDLLKKLEDMRSGLKTLSSESIEIAAAFELSYRGLSDDQRMLFRRLGLHPGIDISIEAAAELLGYDIETTEQLVDGLYDHSLLNEPEQGRYRFHDLLRDYAREQARKEEAESERNASRSRLLHYYLKVADCADRVLEPHRRRFDIDADNSTAKRLFDNHRSALHWFETERLNLLACARMAVELAEHRTMCQLSRVLAHFLISSGYNKEGEDLHGLACRSAQIANDSRLKASALTDLAQSYQASGKFELALSCFNEALELWSQYEEDEGRARTLSGIGFTLERTGQYSQALIELNKALQIRRANRDVFGEAHVLNALGAVHWRLKEYSKALERFETALSLRRKIRDRYGEARTVNNIGFTYQRLGDYANANKWLLEALAIAGELGDRNSEAVTLNNLGYTMESAGDFSSAMSYASEGLKTARLIGSLYEEGRALDALARCAFGQGDMNAAKNYWKESIALFEKAGVPEAQELTLKLQSLSAK